MPKIFSRFLIANFAAMVVSTGFVVVSATTAEAKIKDCKDEYIQHYLRKPGHKAVAVTGARSPYSAGISCGTAWSYGTIEQAINEALRQCRVSDRKFNDPGICQIFKAQ